MDLRANNLQIALLQNIGSFSRSGNQGTPDVQVAISMMFLLHRSLIPMVPTMSYSQALTIIGRRMHNAYNKF